MRKASLKPKKQIVFEAGNKVSHQGNEWVVVGMVGQGLVRITRPGTSPKTVRTNQVRLEQ